MTTEHTAEIIDLFSNSVTERRARRDPAPESGSAQASPERGPAPIVDLFASKASDERHFGRIQEILAVRIAKDRLFVELYVDGPALPARYLCSLTFTVDDPLAGVSTCHKVEAVKINGHYVGLRSEPLKGALKEGRELKADAVVRVTSPNGRMIQNFIQPLLDAKP